MRNWWFSLVWMDGVVEDSGDDLRNRGMTVKYKTRGLNGRNRVLSGCAGRGLKLQRAF